MTNDDSQILVFLQYCIFCHFVFFPFFSSQSLFLLFFGVFFLLSTLKFYKSVYRHGFIIYPFPCLLDNCYAQISEGFFSYFFDNFIFFQLFKFIQELYYLDHFISLFFKRFYLFIFRERGGEGKRETSMCGYLLSTPYWGLEWES